MFEVSHVRRFVLAFVVAWVVALFLGLLVFGAQVVAGTNATYAGEGSSVPLAQLAGEGLDAVMLVAPSTAIRAAAFVGITLLLTVLIERVSPQTRSFVYPIAGAIVPLAILGAQDWQLHWVSGAIGAIAMLGAAVITRSQPNDKETS